MIDIYCQIKDGKLIPASREYADELKAYQHNQIVRCKITGTRKQRSVQQNAWVHAMFRYVAANTDDPEWNTPEAVKYMVKRVMNFFDYVGIEREQVFFKLRSFAFDRMEHNEANIRYEDCKNICAKKLGVDPEILEAEAKKATMSRKEWNEHKALEAEGS